MPARPALLAALLALPALAGCAAPAAVEPASHGLFSATDVFPGAYDLSGPHPRVLVPGTLRALPDEVVDLPSALDGEAIQVGFVRPDVPDGARVPVVVHASVYLDDLRRRPLVDAFPYQATSAFLVENLVPRGYAVAWVAARGTGGSGGCWDGYGAATRADLDQAVTWLATRPWSDGNVGMVGISWDAVTQWQVAAAGNPHLRTVVVAASEPDLHSFFFRNGTASTLAAPFGHAGFWAMSATGTTTFVGAARGREDAAYAPRTPGPDAVCPELAQGVAAALAGTATGERGDGYWAERDLRPLVEERWSGSVLLVHGLRDEFAWARLVYPWANGLEADGIVVKHLLGQWTHDMPFVLADNPTPRWDFAEVLVRWYDRWLRGDATVDVGPRVQVADSDGRWRSDEAWPPRDAAPRTFHLAPGGALATEPSAARERALLVADPARAVLEPGRVGRLLPGQAGGSLGEGCRGCVEFATEPLPDGLRFAGLPRLPLTVTPTGPGGSVTAYLFVEGTDGRRLVSAGQMDLRFADGGETARAVEPGRPLVARLELEACDVVVPPGGRLVLALGQGGYGALLNYYRSSQPAWPVAVEVGGDASALTVLAFERGEDAYFEAPSP